MIITVRSVDVKGAEYLNSGHTVMSVVYGSGRQETLERSHDPALFDAIAKSFPVVGYAEAEIARQGPKVEKAPSPPVDDGVPAEKVIEKLAEKVKEDGPPKTNDPQPTVDSIPVPAPTLVPTEPSVVDAPAYGVPVSPPASVETPKE